MVSEPPRCDREGGAVTIRSTLTWITQSGRPIIAECRTSSVDALPDVSAWWLVFDTEMLNIGDRTLAIGSPTTNGRPNAGYGGLAWRGPDTFTGGTVHVAAGPGGDDLRGTVQEWMGISERPAGGHSVALVVMLADPEGFSGLPRWFVRTDEYALLCPAPFFDQTMSIPPGAARRFRFAVVVADTTHPARIAATIAQRGRELMSYRRG
jgi:hypothetical protein